MNTCYAVIGTPRSGSSALAGVMHSLGINMGPSLMNGMEHNIKGFYEDIEFLGFHQFMYGEIPNLSMNNLDDYTMECTQPKYTNLIRTRCVQEKWGLKDPRLVFVLKNFSEYLMNCKLKIVSTARPINLSAKSMGKLLKVDYRKASEIIGRYEIARLDTLQWASENNIETLVVPYNDLVDKTEEIISSLAKFCDIDDELTIQQAKHMVDPGLRNNK